MNKVISPLRIHHKLSEQNSKQFIKEHTGCLSRMDIDDVPIKANMTHSEWKSIDPICMISMILPSLSKTMALWRWLGREKCFIRVSHSKVQEGWGWSQGMWGQGKNKHSAPCMSPQSSWPEEGTGERTLCSAGPREVQVFSVEEACTSRNSWVRGRRGPFFHCSQGVRIRRTEAQNMGL